MDELLQLKKPIRVERRKNRNSSKWAYYDRRGTGESKDIVGIILNILIIISGIICLGAIIYKIGLN